MPFLIAPVANFSGDTLVSLQGVQLRDSPSIAGLINGVAYRALNMELSAPSPVFTPVSAQAAPANIGITPLSRWHPQFSNVTLSGGRVTAASDLTGLAALTEGLAGQGPRAMVDALGRRFWRFSSDAFLDVATTLSTATRNMGVFFVGRMHRTRNEPSTTATHRIFAAGSVKGGTATNTSGGALEVWSSGGSAPWLRSHARAGFVDTVNAAWMLAGTQMQVLGAVSRTSANGGTRLWVNTKFADVLQNGVDLTVAGGEIGRWAWTAEVQGARASFDLYELIITTGITNAQGAAIAAALTQHYAIPEIQHQLVVEGDSLTHGFAPLTGENSSGAQLTAPGAGLIPANWRVINMGVAGSQVADLTARRDVANGWASTLIPGGQNVVAFEVGRNDMVPGAGGLSATAHYANVVTYLTAPTTGLLARGWTVRQVCNIATTPNAQIEAYRALIRQPQYLIDTQTGAGQAYEGRLSLVPTDQITIQGNTVFLTAADSADTLYYQGDLTHPNALGVQMRVSGGDNPAHGIAWGLA